MFLHPSARKSYRKILYPIYHTGLRLALGAFKTSPVESLYAESYETPPKSRCDNLALKYYLKLKADPLPIQHTIALLDLNVKLSSNKKKKPSKPLDSEWNPSAKKQTYL